MKKNTRVHVPVSFYKEGDYVVAYCPALELSSYGKTEEAAKRAFGRAVSIFLEETQRKGTLERVLLSLGWSLRQKPSCRYELPLFPAKSTLGTKMAMSMVKQTVTIPCAPLKEISAHAVSS
jgi:predicted RNase H-like HicB family nuclease